MKWAALAHSSGHSTAHPVGMSVRRASHKANATEHRTASVIVLVLRRLADWWTLRGWKLQPKLLTAQIHNDGEDYRLATGWEVRSLKPGWGKRFFPSPHPSRSGLRPSQPPLQAVPGLLAPGIKRPGRDVDIHTNLVPRLRMSRANLYSTLCLYGVLREATLTNRQ